MSYARLIVNPVAGARRTAKKWPQIMGLLQSIGLHFEHDLTEAPGHARELAKSAAKKGYELVVSVGGDGTINEVVNGLSHQDFPSVYHHPFIEVYGDVLENHINVTWRLYLTTDGIITSDSYVCIAKPA